MSKLEIINGTKYINGYLCNEAGKPITLTNGYSSEDERDAERSYERAKRLESEEMKLRSKNREKQISKKTKIVRNLNTNDKEF